MRQIAEIESEIGWDFRIGNKDSRDSIAFVAVSCKASIIEFLRKLKVKLDGTLGLATRILGTL